MYFSSFFFPLTFSEVGRKLFSTGKKLNARRHVFRATFPDSRLFTNFAVRPVAGSTGRATTDDTAASETWSMNCFFVGKDSVKFLLCWLLYIAGSNFDRAVATAQGPGDVYE